MDDAQLLIMELGGLGYSCAQMVLLGGLRLMGRENPDLIRAMGGLAQGVGCSGEICGALSGGVCLIALHTEKGLDAESSLPQAQPLMNELVEWFRAELCRGGALTCDAILGLNDVVAGPACGRSMNPAACGGLVARTWTRAVSLLMENGIDPSQGREEG